MLLYGRHQHSIVKTNKQMHKKPQWDTTVTSFEWLSTKILMIPSKTVFGEKLGLLCIYRGNAELYGHSGNQYAKFLPCCYCSVAKSCLALLTSWTAAHQASLSFTISQSLLKLMSIELMMPFNHLILSVFSSCFQYFPASGSFPMSRLFASGGQSIGPSESVLPKRIFRVDFL